MHTVELRESIESVEERRGAAKNECLTSRSMFFRKAMYSSASFAHRSFSSSVKATLPASGLRLTSSSEAKGVAIQVDPRT